MLPRRPAVSQHAQFIKKPPNRRGRKDQWRVHSLYAHIGEERQSLATLAISSPRGARTGALVFFNAQRSPVSGAHRRSQDTESYVGLREVRAIREGC